MSDLELDLIKSAHLVGAYGAGRFAHRFLAFVIETAMKTNGVWSEDAESYFYRDSGEDEISYEYYKALEELLLRPSELIQPLGGVGITDPRYCACRLTPKGVRYATERWGDPLPLPGMTEALSLLPKPGKIRKRSLEYGEIYFSKKFYHRVLHPRVTISVTFESPSRGCTSKELHEFGPGETWYGWRFEEIEIDRTYHVQRHELEGLPGAERYLSVPTDEEYSHEEWIEDRVLVRAVQHGLPGANSFVFPDLPTKFRKLFSPIVDGVDLGKPLLAFVGDTETWTLLGTRKVASSHGGHTVVVQLREIVEITRVPGDTAEKLRLEHLSVVSKQGSRTTLWGPPGSEIYTLWGILLMISNLKHD